MKRLARQGVLLKGVDACRPLAKKRNGDATREDWCEYEDFDLKENPTKKVLRRSARDRPQRLLSLKLCP
jgi:hypothetical protein